MTTTKHTPGPWIVSPDGDLPNRPFKVGKLMYCVADVGEASDAKLIAAAPELLEALVMMLNVDNPDSVLTNNWTVENWKAAKRNYNEVAKEVIDKATI